MSTFGDSLFVDLNGDFLALHLVLLFILDGLFVLGSEALNTVLQVFLDVLDLTDKGVK